MIVGPRGLPGRNGQSVCPSEILPGNTTLLTTNGSVCGKTELIIVSDVDGTVTIGNANFPTTTTLHGRVAIGDIGLETNINSDQVLFNNLPTLDVPTLSNMMYLTDGGTVAQTGLQPPQLVPWSSGVVEFPNITFTKDISEPIFAVSISPGSSSTPFQDILFLDADVLTENGFAWACPDIGLLGPGFRATVDFQSTANSSSVPFAVSVFFSIRGHTADSPTSTFFYLATFLPTLMFDGQSTLLQGQSVEDTTTTLTCGAGWRLTLRATIQIVPTGNPPSGTVISVGPGRLSVAAGWKLRLKPS